MSEKLIVNNIMRYLRLLDKCFCYKNHGGRFGTSGIPDIIVCFEGKFVAFEVKTLEGRATELQKRTIRKINEAEGTAFIVRSVDEVKEIIGGIADEG